MNLPDDTEDMIRKVTDMCKWLPQNFVKEFRDDAVADLAEAVIDGDTGACYAAEKAIKSIDAVALARFHDWKPLRQ